MIFDRALATGRRSPRAGGKPRGQAADPARFCDALANRSRQRPDRDMLDGER